jgi:L-threonylcarbamoyladenylate synthase
VAFPTGTSYGLAADTLQGWALQRLRNLKNRPTEKTFTVFMRAGLYNEFLYLTAFEQALLTKMAQQPLTLLVKPTDDLAHLAQEGLIGLRVIDHPLMQALADAVDVPLTATSANRHGQPPCFSPREIERIFTNPLPDDQLGEENPRGATNTTYDLSLSGILDGGDLPTKKPTTIAKVVGDTIEIIRKGPVSIEQLTTAG